MDVKKIIEKAREIALEEASKLNLEIIDVDYVKENGIKILRIIAEGKEGLTIDENILSSIKQLIASKRAASAISEATANEDAWTSYVQLLKLQDAQKAAKQLGEEYIDLYIDNYNA